MNPLILTTLILFLTSSPIYAQQADKLILPYSGEFKTFYTSKGITNGHHWKLFNSREKGAYLLGYESGVINTATYYLPDKKERKEIFSDLPALAGDIPIDNLVKRVDKFYSDDKNLNIPIPYVLLIIKNRLTEVGEKEIDEYIKELRNYWDFGIIEGKTIKAEVKEILQAESPDQSEDGKVWKWTTFRLEELKDGKIWTGMVEHTVTFDDNDIVKEYSVIEVTDKHSK